MTGFDAERTKQLSSGMTPICRCSQEKGRELKSNCALDEKLVPEWFQPLCCSECWDCDIQNCGSPSVIRSLGDVRVPEVLSRDVQMDKREDGSLDIIGEGSYGVVVRGVHTKDRQDNAIVAKYFRKNRSSMRDVSDEAKIQSYLQDTGVVPKIYGFMDTGREDQYPALIQECFAEGHTLYDVLVDPPKSKKTCYQVCLEAAKGLQKIHAKRVLLNDVKPDNILVDFNRNVENTPDIRFIDMGLATFDCRYVTPISEAAMAECYHMAPEVKKQRPSSVKSDIFSLGFVFEQLGKAAGVGELVALGSLLTFEDPSMRLELSMIICCLTSLVDDS